MTNIQCIILIQKRVIRLIHGANLWNHTNNLFYYYRILKFNDIVEQNVFNLCLMPIIMFYQTIFNNYL